MRIALVLLLAALALAACSGSGRRQAPATPRTSAEQLAAEAALAEGTPEALRGFLAAHRAAHARGERGEHARRVAELYERRAREALQAALALLSEDALDAHVERYPEHADAESVRALRAGLRRGGAVDALRRARSVRLELTLASDEDPVEFPEPLARALRELLEHAGLDLEPLAEPDVTIAVTGEATVGGVAYLGNVVRRNAVVEFNGVLEVEEAHGGRPHAEPLFGFVRNAPAQIVVPQHRSADAMRGRLAVADALEAARALDALAALLLEARGVAPLARALASTTSAERDVAPFTRYYLADAAQRVLCGVDAEGEVDALRPLLAAPDARVQARAVRALERHWVPGVDDPEVERLAYYFLGTWRDGAAVTMHGFTAASLGRAVEELSATGEAQERAAMLLSTLGRPGVDALVAQVLDEATLDVAKAHALGRAREQAIAALLPMLERDDEQGARARDALLFLGSAPAIEHVRSMGWSRHGPRLRRAEARVAFTPLLAQLEEGDGFAREAAARELGRTGDERAYAPLIALLEDPLDQISEAAAEALGWYGDVRALAAIRAARDARGDLHGLFEQAIGRLTAYGR